MTQDRATPHATARSYVYTAAPFGHEGINGFQFVGLPAAADGAEMTDFLAEHIGYTAPLGLPSQPDADQIAVAYPRSTRIIPNAPAGCSALIRSVYVGQVYQADGVRGKWGNFLGHALVFTHPPAPRDLLAMALTAPWRDALTEEEVARGAALDLPDTEVSAPVATAGARLSDAEMASAVAAILARLAGDTPLLLDDTPPEAALETFQEIAALLDPRLLARLRWSSFEFDGGADYDVMATCGDTQLAQNAAAYYRLSAPPSDAALIWVGEAACREGEQLWNRLALFCDLGSGGPFGEAIGVLMALEQAGPEDVDQVSRSLAMILEGPPEDDRVEAASRIFASGFSGLSEAQADDFAFLVIASHEAERLFEWSGSDVFSQQLIGWASAFPSVSAAFGPRADPIPLAGAMERAVAQGAPREEVLEVALAAADARLSGGADPSAFTAALHALLPEGGRDWRGLETLMALIELLSRDPEREAILSDLVSRTADGASVAWLDKVSRALREASPQAADRLLPELRLRMFERESANADQAAAVARAMVDFGPDKLPADSTVIEILERLSCFVPAQRGTARTTLARDIMTMADGLGLARHHFPNALALYAAANAGNAEGVLRDADAFEAVLRRSDATSFAAFFDRAWGIVAPPELSAPDEDALSLWRQDTRAHFVETATRHFLALSGSAAERVADALTAHARAAPSGLAGEDWAVVAETVALRLGTRLTEEEFEELAHRHRRSPLIDRMAKRRSRTVGAVAKSISGAVRNLFSRRDGHG